MTRFGLVLVIGSSACAILTSAGCGSTTTRTTTTTKVVVRTTTATHTRTVTLSPEPATYVPEAGGTPEYKPDAIYIGVSSSGYSIRRWLSYGRATATALATFDSNDCTPDCAAGHITTIHLKIVLSRRVPCKGVPAYADLEVVRSDNEALMSSGHEDDLSSLCTEG
jgi:hypothetical protein